MYSQHQASDETQLILVGTQAAWIVCFSRRYVDVMKRYKQNKISHSVGPKRVLKSIPYLLVSNRVLVLILVHLNFGPIISEKYFGIWQHCYGLCQRMEVTALCSTIESFVFFY